MLCETHKLIASKLYETVKSEYGKYIDYQSLLEGSIAPDNVPSMIIIPHTKKNSSGFLNKQIQYLINCSSIQDFNPKDFSYRLGIVIHFVSDYFCTAHNHYLYINPVVHHIYERKLKNYFKRNISGLILNSATKNSDSLEKIRSFLDEKHIQFKSLKQHLENDFIFTMEATAFTTASILGICTAALCMHQDLMHKKSA